MGAALLGVVTGTDPHGGCRALVWNLGQNSTVDPVDIDALYNSDNSPNANNRTRDATSRAPSDSGR